MLWNPAVAQELLDVLFAKAAELDERDRQRIQEGGTAVDFMGLNNQTCRWPLFEGHEPFYEKLYCGAPTISGGHYCDAGQAFGRRRRASSSFTICGHDPQYLKEATGLK